MKKNIAILISSLFLTVIMQAQDRTQPQPGPSPKININKPETFTLPNGLALSFEFILDPQDTGRSKSEIHSYEQNSLILDAKLLSLGSARCESESIEITRFHCVTEFSQDYFFDIASGTALEKSDGFRAQFNCRFF